MLYRRLLMVLLVVLLVINGAAPLLQAQAQNNAGVTITLAIPQFQEDNYQSKFFTEFETATGIKVKVVKKDASIPNAASGLDKHFESTEAYVKSADVLYVDITTMSPEATRAGYYLDMMPLAVEDKTLAPDSFFQPIWQSYQWDKALWAMPVAADIYMLSYSPEAFDKAGLPYPTDKWTYDDLIDAVRKLAEKDADGKVTKPGIDAPNFLVAYAFRTMLNGPLFDTSTIPNTPKLDTPEVIAMLEKWHELDKDGYVGQSFNNEAPLNITAAITLALPGTSDGKKRAGSLLPGGKAAANVTAFAVSGGTQHPVEAYKLAAWMTTRPEIASAGFASAPARKTLVGKTGSNAPAVSLNISAEVQALIDKGLANTIPISEFRFVDYLAVAYSKMKLEKLDAKTALQTSEANAIKAQTAAAEKKDKLKGQLVVDKVEDSNLPKDKIALKFGINTFMNPMPNKAQWDKFIADFVASDPQVGKVTLESSVSTIDQISKKYDCFYLSYNAVTGSDVSSVLSLDPYLSADKTFDKSDIVGNLMAQVQRNNQTYALPVDIQPNALQYDVDSFAKAGAGEPPITWKVDAFTQTLQTLRPDPKDGAPFVPLNTGGTWVLSLSASFGGILLDYRTNPPTINFTDPKTVAAVRQALDLAKDGYIKYKALGSNQLDFGPAFGKAIIAQTSLGAFAFRMPGGSSNAKSKVVLYPVGTDFAAVTYIFGTMYISKNTPAPDACYRFISAASRNPNLFSAMPARRSLLNDQQFVTAQGADTIALYKQIDALLQDPKTVGIPGLSLLNQAALDTFYYLWLGRAFDAYVLKDGDLEAVLKDAEMQAKTFQGCSGTIPPFDAGSPDKQREFYKAFKECALKADPSLKPLLDAIKVD